MTPDEELERLLKIVPEVEVSPGFNEAVFRRIHAPKLVHVFAEPILPFAIALIAALAWKAQTIATALTAVTNDVSVAIGQLSVGLAIGITPLLFLIAWQLFRVCERI
jgi:hypothetical protein